MEAKARAGQNCLGELCGPFKGPWQLNVGSRLAVLAGGTCSQQPSFLLGMQACLFTSRPCTTAYGFKTCIHVTTGPHR